MLSKLAPGDFAAARRRIELMGGNTSADELLKTLREESGLKPDGRRKPIGFTWENLNETMER